MSTTDRKKQFAIEYSQHFNATRAGRAVGISNSGAWMRDPEVLEYIAAELEERQERTRVNSDWVLLQLADMFETDIMDVMESDGTLKPVERWPASWRKIVSAFDVTEQFDRDTGERIGQMKKVKLMDKLKVLETIGRHINVQAFRDRIEVTEKNALATKIRNARKRA